MRFLSLSTAEQCCSLAVIDYGTLVHEEFWSSRLTHSKRLLQMIEHSLENRAGVLLSDIDAFVAAKGPGSFTGLRIGISVVQALSYSTGQPALGVSSLDGIAWRFSQASEPVCVMMDARRNEVYTAVYQFSKGQLLSKSREKVVQPQEAIVAAGQDAVFTGTGSKAYQPLIKEMTKKATITDEFFDPVSAAGLVRAVTSKPDFLNNSGNILVPSYIRKSDAELQFVEKQG